MPDYETIGSEVMNVYNPYQNNFQQPMYSQPWAQQPSMQPQPWQQTPQQIPSEQQPIMQQPDLAQAIHRLCDILESRFAREAQK